MEYFRFHLWIWTCLSILLRRVEMGRVDRMFIKDGVFPIKGGDLQIVCEVSQFTSSSVLTIYRLENIPDTLADQPSLASCIPTTCIGNIDRLTFTPSSTSVTITISKLNRAEDQTWWICAIGASRKELHVTVYSVPQTLRFDSPPSQDQDLAENAFTLRCSTGCTYPQPSFKWFYTELGGSRQNWSTLGSDTDTTGGCTDSEKIYTSTLSLAKYSTFPGNLDKTVKFTCGIPTFTGMTEPLYTNPSVNIQFAVKVTSVTLMYGNIKAPTSIKVTSGISTHFTCTTSASRPASTNVWYIGDVEKQRSTSEFTFTPQESDHNKQVYCKAFNIQQESQAVTSNKATLDVQVQVTSVTLKDGNNDALSSIKMTSGVPKTLTCTTSASRPKATIIWFFGGNEQKRSNSSSTFTFTPNNNDHDKQVFCKAFNIQNENQAVSSHKATLYVQVPATTPTITNRTAGILFMMENDSVSMECISSTTRPLALVTWKKGTQLLTDVQNTNSTTPDGLMRVRSIVTFTPKRNDDNENIYCETAIPGQQTKSVTQQRITVYWPPSAPSIPTKDFPFLEGQSGKTLNCSSNEYGNPRSSATWNSNYGTQDTSDSKILNLPVLNKDIDKSKVSCQVKNHFTQAKGLAVTSPTIIMDIQYNPVVRIMAGGQNIQSITKIEGENFAANCSAVGNPVPTVKWIRQTTGSELRFNDIDRKDHGTYTCRAEATSEKYRDHDFVTLRNLSVVVFYAPNVSVSLSTEPTENLPLMISCNAVGRPNNFTYISIIQTWNGITIPNTHRQNNGFIDIKNLQLQDSGIYTCKVKNDIRDRNQQIDQTGKSEVSFKVSPKVLLERNYRFAGAPGKSVNITIPFYSFPDISSVMFKFPNGSEIKDSAKYTVSFMKSNVTDRFYGQQVELEGHIAALRIRDEDEADFLNYTLVLDNGIGQHKEWTIYHVSESIPSVPKFLKFTGIVDGVPTFLLLGSFNGGRPQYFRVETSILGTENWKEHLKFSETDKTFLLDNKLTFHFNVTGLTPNTYEIRVLAGNDLGWIENKDAPVTTFTVQGHTYQKHADTETEADIVPGAVGGAAAGVVIIAIVVVVVVMYRRNSCTKEKVGIIAGKMIKRKKTTDENTIEMSSQDNPVGMYEQLQRNEERGNKNVYDSLGVATDNTVYENLQKGAISSSGNVTVHTAAPNDSSHTTYENLKLNL